MTVPLARLNTSAGFAAQPLMWAAALAAWWQSVGRLTFLGDFHEIGSAFVARQDEQGTEDPIPGEVRYPSRGAAASSAFRS